MKIIHRLVWASAFMIILSACGQPSGQSTGGKPDVVGPSARRGGRW
ncbi:MAG: hypothetical protein JXB07_20145 [Anaerolineae bacterium]|nr:hypothetical protein [Anaerolineae bacterium]